MLAWVAGALLVLLGVVLTLPFSGPGTRALVAAANELEILNIEYRGGRLFGELELASLRLQLGAVDLELAGIVTDLQWRCFWRSVFCLRRGVVDRVAVAVKPATGPEPDGPPNREVFSFPYEIRVDALQVGQLSVRWEGGQWRQGTMEAAVQFLGEQIDIRDATINEPTLQLEGGADTGEGYAGFEPPAIFLPLELRIAGLALSGGGLEYGEQTWPLGAGTLAGRWRGHTLELTSLRASAPALGALNAGGQVDFRDSWPLALEAQLQLDPDIEPPQLRGRTGHLSLAGDLGGLALELRSPGSPILAASGELAPGGRDLPFAVDWELAWPAAMPLVDLVPGAPTDLVLSSPLEGQVSGNLLQQELWVHGQVNGAGYEALELRGQARWLAPVLEVSHLELRDAASDSLLIGQGALRLAERWSLQSSLESAGFNLPTLPAVESGRLGGRLDLALSGTQESWQLALSEIALEGEVNGLPARIRGSSGIDSSLQLLPGTLQADINGALLSVFADKQTGQARANLAVDELGRWVSGARGSLSISATGDLAGERLSLNADAANLVWGEYEMGRAEATASWRGATGAVDARVSIPELQIIEDEMELRQVQLSVVGSVGDHRIQLSSRGALSGQLVVDGSLAQGRWQGRAQDTTVTTPAGDWVLPESVALAWDGEARQFHMDAHCWRHEQFQLCGEQLRAGAEGDLQLSLSGNARAFSGMLPRGLHLRGPLEADLSARWGQGRPLALDLHGRGKALTIIRRYGMGESVEVTWESVQVDLQRQDGELLLDGEVWRGGRRVLSLDAKLPERRNGELAGTAVLDGLKLAAFAPWVTELSELSGELGGRVELSGTPAEPRARGELTLANGHMVALGNPTALTDLDLRLTLQGDRGRLAGRGLLGGGALNLRGQLYTAPDLRLDVQVTGERHQVLVPPSTELLVSEELQLVIVDGLLDVSGNVHVLEGVLHHEELPESGVSMSSDVVVVDVTGAVISEERPFEIRSDVWLKIRDRFVVEGKSLRATLGGDLHLVREPGRPLQLFGTLSLVGGELNAYRQRLQIQRGTIAFSGPADNPELNISAEREIRADNVTVGARLTGRLDEPELDIYSDPVMSQSEAMSYLVRGRGLDSGAGADGTALALSLGADMVNQSGVVAELNRLPMLSNVAFGATGEQEETSATVSGYIGERIYLSYGIGIYEPINVLTARLYLQSRLWLEVVSRLENSVDLYYSFDID